MAVLRGVGSGKTCIACAGFWKQAKNNAHLQNPQYSKKNVLFCQEKKYIGVFSITKDAHTQVIRCGAKETLSVQGVPYIQKRGGILGRL